MRLLLNCMTCFQVNGEPSSLMTSVDLGNGEAYVHTCSAGHVNHTVLQQMQFELLFEAGFHGVVDGYCREAVGTFAAALERFQEFALRVCCAKLGMASDALEGTWTEVRNASERQYGAFVFVYSITVGKMPSTLTRKQREFRNDVVHKGTFCNEADALAFGEQVRTLVVDAISELRKVCSKELDATVTHAMFAASATVPNGGSLSTMCIPTILSLISRDESTKALSQIAAEVRAGTRTRWLR
jgi:hypothetical protein